jgi:hypothetical protein
MESGKPSAITFSLSFQCKIDGGKGAKKGEREGGKPEIGLEAVDWKCVIYKYHPLITKKYRKRLLSLAVIGKMYSQTRL